MQISPASTKNNATIPGRRNIYPNQPGITKSIEEYTEDPQQYLQRSLAKDEEVLEQFDVYFPTQMIPRWKLVILCISTFGLYLIVLAYRALLRWCYKNKCLSPLVYVLQRGKVSFNEFNHHGTIGSNSFVSTRPNTETAGFLMKFQQWFDRSVTGGIEMISNMFGLTHRSHVFYIVSNTADMVRNGDIHAVLEDVNELYARVMTVIPGIEDKFVQNDNIPKGKYSETDKFVGVTIVDTDMSISIPPKWFQLLPSEQVLNSVGLVFRMSALDYLYSGCTLGYYYCSTIHHKKFKRSAIVLTNKRIIVVDLNQRAGMIPSHLGDFEITVRCYIPGPLTHGYIYSSSFQHLESAVSGLGGTIHIDFPTLPGAGTRTAYLPFAKAIQQVKRRVDSKMSSDIESQLTGGKKDNWMSAKIASEGAMLGADYLTKNNKPLDSSDLNVIPLIPGEEIVDLIRGLPKWEPFCNLLYWSYGPEISNNFAPVNLCDKGKCCFPMFPYVCTCALRPFRTFNDIIITNHSVLQYVRQKNDGIFGFFGPIADVQPFFWPCDGSSIICQTNSSFMVIWAPNDTLNGHTVQYEYIGQEAWFSRMCRHNACGKICCPVNDASYDLVLHAGDLNFLSSGNAKNTNWKDSPSLQKAEQLLNNIEVMNR